MEICRDKFKYLRSEATGTKYLKCGQIHGDLTYRNIVSYNKNNYYFDLDRSELSFPEFDLFMLHIDTKMVLEDMVSYKNSLKYAESLFENHEVSKHIQLFYKVSPEYSTNQKYYSIIVNLFYVRVLAYIFSDASFDANISVNNLL